MYLRLLVIVRLPKYECEKLVSEGVIVAGKGCKNDQTKRARSNQHCVVRIEVGQGSPCDDNVRTCVESAPVARRSNCCVEDEVNCEATSYDHFYTPVARTH